MLYPNFDDLVAFKETRSNFVQPNQRLVKSTLSGHHHSPFRGHGLEFDAVREYVPGDDIRNIDWRVTARTNSPHLKIFKEERERQVMLCVDMNASMRFGTRNTFKSIQAAYAAAFLGWKSLSSHDRISAYLFGDIPNGIQLLAPTRTRQSFCKMLKALTDQPVLNPSVSLESVFQQLNKVASSGSLIYIISDFLAFSPQLNQNPHLNRLSQVSDLIFISINDRADQALFPAGWLEFCNSQNEKTQVNTHDSLGMKAYAEQWKKNRYHLKDATLKLKIPLVELTTESDIRRDLFLGLKNMSKRKKR